VGKAQQRGAHHGRRVGLVVTFVPKVPFWKSRDFNVLRHAFCDNALI
jgi:hypothetical protein